MVTLADCAETALRGAEVDAKTSAGFLSKLLNRTVAADTVLRLSSAQRARFAAWLHVQGTVVNAASLVKEFKLSDLFSGSAELAPDGMVARTSEMPVNVVGVDLQSISELVPILPGADLKTDPELLRLFTLHELSYAQARPNPAETLAGLFAAKEAIRKCIGVGNLSAEEFRDLEILPDALGRPTIAGYDLSIAHSGDFAMAIALSARPSVEAPVVAGPVIAERVNTGRTNWLQIALTGVLLAVAVLQLLLLTYVHHRL